MRRTPRVIDAVAGRINDTGLWLGAAALFVILSLVYVFSIEIRATRSASITGDEPFYLLTTQSLLADRDLDLSNQYAARSYEEFFDHPTGLWRQSIPAEDGRLLSPHNPGLSVLIMPGFALGGLAGAQAQLLVMAAATLSLAFVLADRLIGVRAAAWLATLGVGLTAIAFIHSTEIYPEFPAALALVLALLVATRGRRLTTLDAVLLCILLTAICWLGIKYAPLAVLVAAFSLMRSEPNGRITLLGLGALSAAIYVWFHLKTFGELTPYSVSVVYGGMSTVETLGQHIEFQDRIYRLWGIFVDRRFGIGRWAPLLLAVVPGMVLLARGTSTMRLVLGLILTQLLIAVFVVITMMGWWFAGRTMVTVVPLMALPLALLLSKAGSAGRVLIALLAVYSIIVTAGLALAGHSREITIAVDPFDMRFLPFRALSPVFPQYTSWTGETWALTVFWVGLAALAVVIAASPVRASSLRIRRRILYPSGVSASQDFPTPSA